MRLLLRVCTLLLMVGLAMGAALSDVRAQDDGSTSDVEASPPADGGETELPVGVLQISSLTCSSGGEPGTVEIFLAEEFAPEGDCIESSSAILVDGVDYGPASPLLELSLDAGWHNLTEINTGASRDVEVFADSLTSALIVMFSAVPEEEVAPAETEPVIVSFVAHACKPAVQSADELFALGGPIDRLLACPAMTLPGHSAPGGSETGGEWDFDFTLQSETGETLSLTGNGSFVPSQMCESDVGALDNILANDLCISDSDYDLTAPDEPLTIIQTVIPPAMRFAAAEIGDPADSAALTGVDAPGGVVSLDPTLRSSEQMVVHFYYLNPPRVSVVNHLCGDEIGTVEQFDALPGIVDKLFACPAVSRSTEGGPADFDISVADAGSFRTLGESVFEPDLLCESDLDLDWNGVPEENECLDAPTYRFDQTIQGGVAIQESAVPAGYQFAGAESVPGSGDEFAIVAVDPASASASLDTSFDGDVTIHLFNVLAQGEPSSTAEPTSVPTETPVPPPTPTEPEDGGSETGIITVAALYCLGNETSTTITALSPGQQASAADLGDSSCFAGDTEVQIYLFGEGAMPAFRLGRDGVESVQGIPVTGAGGATHLIIEQISGVQEAFEVAPDEVTRLIIRIEVSQGGIDEGLDDGNDTADPPGQTIGDLITDDLITDEFFSDDGMLLPGAFDDLLYTSLLVDDLDADEVANLSDAESLPGVGASPVHRHWGGLPIRVFLGMAFALMISARRVAGRHFRPGRVERR
jgi:hypothetical protein